MSLVAHVRGIIFSVALIPTLLSAIEYTEKEKTMINHVKKSIENAENGVSKLTDEVLEIKGMSNNIVRRFLNNVCAFPGATYFEVGTWKGSTLVSALFKNEKFVEKAIAIDNFSKWGGPRNAFYANIDTFIPKAKLSFYDCHSFKLTDEQMSEIFTHPIKVYFYDGDHSALSQELAFTYFNNIFDDVFVAVVDDWKRADVRKGTFSAFEKLGYTVLFEEQFFSKWWQGMYIGVIRKN